MGQKNCPDYRYCSSDMKDKAGCTLEKAKICLPVSIDGIARNAVYVSAMKSMLDNKYPDNGYAMCRKIFIEEGGNSRSIGVIIMAARKSYYLRKKNQQS